MVGGVAALPTTLTGHDSVLDLVVSWSKNDVGEGLHIIIMIIYRFSTTALVAMPCYYHF